VTWATSVPISVFLGLSILDLGPMYVTDRQTSDAHHRLMPLGRGHNKVCIERSDGVVTDLFRDCAKRVDASLYAARAASLAAAFK